MTPAPCPVSAQLFRQHLALPMHAELTDDDVDHVVAVLSEVIDEQLARDA
jgi:dTDP-4-amino-4,6-dideoxygalactose transaminase